MQKKIRTKFMDLAINLARKNIGITGKNPSVGCVIVKDDQILATGVTAPGGRPHAERIAIDKIKDKAILQQSTLYVSLEPCIKDDADSCSKYIIEHKIPEVVIAMSDPNKMINNKSIAKLKAVGIYVKTDLLVEKAQKINQYFNHSQTSGMPFITLKIATSLDGKIATRSYDSKCITNEKSRRYAHYLRSINDAILIGANSLRKDNPQLNCRISGLKNYSPDIFILSQSCNFDENLQVFSENNKQKIFIITNSGDDEKIKKISQFNKNINIIKINNGDNYLSKICELGYNSVLVEGGSQIASDLIKNKQIDRLIWMRSKKIIGNDGIAAISNLEIDRIDKVISEFKKKDIKIFDEDVAEIFEKDY